MTKYITTLTIITAILISLFGWQPALATPPPILITEVQTGFIDDSAQDFPLQEFIELTNTSQTAVNLTGWKLEYLSAANDGTTAPTQTIDTLNGQISAGGHGIWEHEGYYPIAPDSIFGVGDRSASGFLAKSGGHVRLMNGSTTIDCVSWGSAVPIVGCDKVAAIAGAGYTVQRIPTNGVYDKSTGVANIRPASPQGNNIYAVAVEPPVVFPPPSIITTPGAVCESVQLSEILANPAGDDAQGEYIELYNPANYAQTLGGCSLQLATGRQYLFKATDLLEPHQYKSFMYATTGLQLGNSGGSVTLVTATDQTTTTYPAVGDDQAWAFVDGAWYATTQPTPNAANLPNPAASVETAVLVTSLVAELEPCPAGKYRSPETNRCRNIGVPETTAAVCTTGQERNPATGRCRKVTVAAAQTPCLADQERNPETGRCRKVTATTSAQKPCDPGQERNPETNRCRKIANTSGKVLGASAEDPKTYHYVLVGIVLTGVLGYGLYEYRQTFGKLLNRLKKGRAAS